MQSYAEQVSQLLATEKNLRLQLATDGEKFQQFQVSFILCLTFMYQTLCESTPLSFGSA